MFVHTMHFVLLPLLIFYKGPMGSETRTQTHFLDANFADCGIVQPSYTAYTNLHQPLNQLTCQLHFG